MNKAELLAALRDGERLYAEDRILMLGDPAQIVPAQLVKELIAEGMLEERWIAADYVEFLLKK